MPDFNGSATVWPASPPPPTTSPPMTHSLAARVLRGGTAGSCPGGSDDAHAPALWYRKLLWDAETALTDCRAVTRR